MIDRVLCVRKAYEGFQERPDRSSFDALLRYLNDQFDGSLTLAEADEIMETDYANESCFWERVYNTKNEAAVPLMVMRRLYLYDEVNGSMNRSPEFKRFADNHLGVILAGRDDENEW